MMPTRIIALLAISSIIAFADRCDKRPSEANGEKTPGSSGFQISVSLYKSNNKDRMLLTEFVPGKDYLGKYLGYCLNLLHKLPNKI
jgi:hypothetical protein